MKAVQKDKHIRKGRQTMQSIARVLSKSQKQASVESLSYLNKYFQQWGADTDTFVQQQHKMTYSTQADHKKVLNPENLNPNIKKAQYAVRGELYLRAVDLEKQGQSIVFTNVGNPQQLGQKPYTFNRQVHALVMCPHLLEQPNIHEIFPKDVIDRAKTLLKWFTSVGAYSDSRGATGVRDEIAKFITDRDGYPANSDYIYLTDGASAAVKTMLNCLIASPKDGILTPVPQYPLYSASIQQYGGVLVPYYLNEPDLWSLDVGQLKTTLDEYRGKGINVRAIVFINPGNPTGTCLSYQNLKEVIKFAYDEKLLLMADEVYQENVYFNERPFVSCRKVMYDMGEPWASQQELVSFHTVSKGTQGECGLRGGYFEMINLHPEIVNEIYKTASVMLCPNTIGQVAMSLMVNPPKQGDPSYQKYSEERGDKHESLKRRAQLMTDSFNLLEDVECQNTEGALYTYPQLKLPPKAIEAAKKMGKAPDMFYCIKLLEQTGILTMPGSGFGQVDGTYHLRTTILPPEEQMQDVVKQLTKFHEGFMKEYKH